MIPVCGVPCARRVQRWFHRMMWSRATGQGGSGWIRVAWVPPTSAVFSADWGAICNLRVYIYGLYRWLVMGASSSHSRFHHEMIDAQLAVESLSQQVNKYTSSLNRTTCAAERDDNDARVVAKTMMSSHHLNQICAQCECFVSFVHIQTQAQFLLLFRWFSPFSCLRMFCIARATAEI